MVQKGEGGIIERYIIIILNFLSYFHNPAVNHCVQNNYVLFEYSVSVMSCGDTKTQVQPGDIPCQGPLTT